MDQNGQYLVNFGHNQNQILKNYKHFHYSRFDSQKKKIELPATTLSNVYELKYNIWFIKLCTAWQKCAKKAA